jgi:hypothetical protein
VQDPCICVRPASALLLLLLLEVGPQVDRGPDPFEYHGRTVLHRNGEVQDECTEVIHFWYAIFVLGDRVEG